ncbi:HK97 family phage prohead protease, partial [bacterium]|nr:HK97 family phage prohead protease [bacterium]
MPLPEPTDDETIQQFLDRCLADPHIQDEFPDHDQAMAVCMKQCNQDWDSADEHRDNSETTHQTYFASELRIDTRGKQRRIIGEIPYTSNSRDMGFIEFLRPGCFTDSLKKSDPPIVAFWNHNNDQILGSTANGTLKFQDSLRALRFEIIPPETSFSKDAISLISTGTVSGCSFSFNVRKEAWDKNLREVISADLHEISPCTMPAYPDTSVDVRSKITTHYGRSKNMSPK